MRWLRRIRFSLTQEQWKLLASVFSHIGQAVVLFSAAAFFVPGSVGLPEGFPRGIALAYFFCGVVFLVIAVIIIRKEE